MYLYFWIAGWWIWESVHSRREICIVGGLFITWPWSQGNQQFISNKVSLMLEGAALHNNHIHCMSWFFSECHYSPGAFSIYKKFRKISIGNFRLGRERSICHKSHSFTSPSPSLHQKPRCLGKLFCSFLERVFVCRFPGYYRHVWLWEAWHLHVPVVLGLQW